MYKGRQANVSAVYFTIYYYILLYVNIIFITTFLLNISTSASYLQGYSIT